MISLRNIYKIYKVPIKKSSVIKSFFKRDYQEIIALNNVSFEIAQGEIVGYIGPNGAGKSTTIKIMSGILIPEKGECKILEKTPWENRIEHVKNIGVVFGQRSQLLWDLPVIDSFDLIKDIYNVNENDYKKNLNELIDILNLSKIINTPVRLLSLGQRMICEIAGSLLHNPKILFLDEPTIGLDAISKLAVRDFIKKLNRERNVTIILTTHDMGDIEALTNRVMLIGKGQILFDGNFDDMKKKYNNFSTLKIKHNLEKINFESKNYFEIILNEKNNLVIILNEKNNLVIKINTSKISINKIINYISDLVEIYDIEISQEPIEEIMSKFYKEYDL